MGMVQLCAWDVFHPTNLNTMKKILICMLIAVNVFTMFPSSLLANGVKTTDSLALSHPVDSSYSKELTARLNTIKEMDKSSLSREEKKALRAELRETKKLLRENEGGIYLSVGAVILIVVLLIIFL